MVETAMCHLTPYLFYLESLGHGKAGMPARRHEAGGENEESEHDYQLNLLLLLPNQQSCT